MTNGDTTSVGHGPAGERLTSRTLKLLPNWVRRPSFDRKLLRPGLVHVGVGAFHRCHQAEFLDDLAETGERRWGIVGVNTREPDVIPSLAQQDGLYCRVLRDGGASDDIRVLGSIVRTVEAGDAASAIAALASETVDVVTFTITEKGYCHIPATGEPDPASEALNHDLLHPEAHPRSTPGLVAAALEVRRDKGAGGLSLVSCDNVPANGEVLERMVREVAAARSEALVRWIDSEIGFVSTMVDRIVPATPPGETERLARVLGLVDEAPVVGETFRQWILADAFRGPRRPRLELVGAEITSDVGAYEVLKMRVVNGAQSMLAYLGALAGIAYIYEAAGVPVLRALVKRQLEAEVGPGIPRVSLDVDAYRRTVLHRLANPTILHSTHQVADDGSQKIVPRFVRPLADARRDGRPAPILALGIAAWIRYQSGLTDDGVRFEVSDPSAAHVRTMLREAGPDSQDRTTAALAFQPIFGDLGRDQLVVDMVSRSLKSLQERGSLATAEAMLRCSGFAQDSE